MELIIRTLRYRPRSPLLVMIAGVLAVYLVVSRHVVSAGIVQGDSMVPTLDEGSRYFINHYIYHLREPRRGEVVIFTHPRFDDLTVKRVIGVPGDTVELRAHQVYINGRELEELYLAARPAQPRGWRTNLVYHVPARRYFLMGDNRSHSADSRWFGYVRREDIKGRVIWP